VSNATSFAQTEVNYATCARAKSSAHRVRSMASLFAPSQERGSKTPRYTISGNQRARDIRVYP